jgi:hypothetical protein
MLDQSSPLHTDFCAADWNRLERNPNGIWNAADFLLPAL